MSTKITGNEPMLGGQQRSECPMSSFERSLASDIFRCGDCKMILLTADDIHRMARHEYDAFQDDAPGWLRSRHRQLAAQEAKPG